MSSHDLRSTDANGNLHGQSIEGLTGVNELVDLCVYSQHVLRQKELSIVFIGSGVNASCGLARKLKSQRMAAKNVM